MYRQVSVINNDILRVSGYIVAYADLGRWWFLADMLERLSRLELEREEIEFYLNTLEEEA